MCYILQFLFYLFIYFYYVLAHVFTLMQFVLGKALIKKMAEEVANVARRVNATVEEGKDSLGKL